MIRTYIAIGSNLVEPVQQARAAIRALAALPDSRLVAVSGLYRSKPMGPQDQPDYINAVAALAIWVFISEMRITAPLICSMVAPALRACSTLVCIC